MNFIRYEQVKLSPELLDKFPNMDPRLVSRAIVGCVLRTDSKNQRAFCLNPTDNFTTNSVILDKNGIIHSLVDLNYATCDICLRHNPLEPKYTLAK